LPTLGAAYVGVRRGRAIGLDRHVHVDLTTPQPEALDAILSDLASWQQDGLPVQLHPGDLGWQLRFGPASAAKALRVWTANETVVAIGFTDEASLIRMGIRPYAGQDQELARALGTLAAWSATTPRTPR
jgi:hypothetical protein